MHSQAEPGNEKKMRIHFGPGYRVYFTRVGDVVYVLLCGGAKGRQQRDIAKAQEMARLVTSDLSIN